MKIEPLLDHSRIMVFEEVHVW